jgi:hypothetical protein
MNRPAESMAGNASMTMFVFSKPPFAPPDPPEHPASVATTAVATSDVRHAR